MWFNDVDPCKLHPAISIMHEIAPGTAKRRIVTVAGTDGEIVSDVIVEAGEYIVRVNIAGRTRAEGWALREKIAAWAGSSGNRTTTLVPTHRPGRSYDAILSIIGDPQFTRGFATLDVTFLVPRPIALSASRSSAAGAGRMTPVIGGSAPARPVIAQTLDADTDALTWTMDGRTILTVRGGLAAGTRIEMDTTNESLTADGAQILHMLDPQHTKWRPGYAPGRHEIASSDGGTMEMRWRDEWL